MTIWLDAHLPPSLAPWLSLHFQLPTIAVRDLGLRDALDPPIFEAARVADAVVMTKDADFADMVTRMGPPPRVLWIRSGNTSNATLRELLSNELPSALIQLASGDGLVEIGAKEDY